MFYLRAAADTLIFLVTIIQGLGISYKENHHTSSSGSNAAKEMGTMRAASNEPRIGPREFCRQHASRQAFQSRHNASCLVSSGMQSKR